MRKNPLNFAQKVASVATRSARPAESQLQQEAPVISGRDESTAAAAPEQPPKRTVAALDKNIAAVDQLIARINAKIETAEALPYHLRDSGTVPSLKKSLENAVARKEILERLRSGEVRRDDR